MVSVDVDALGRYLNVSPSKLQTKGVRSVRSRVTNLQAVRPDISVATLKEALRSAYAKYVGHAVEVEVEDASELDAAEVEAARQHFASREWLFRGERLFDESRKGRFAWGEARIDLTCDQGIICDLVVFSDGLDAERIDAIPKLLSGVPKRAEDVEERLLAGGFPTDMAVNIAQLIAN